MRFLCKEKLEKLPGKLENWGKLKVLFCDGYALLLLFFCSL
jgi:hypothetical protein